MTNPTISGLKFVTQINGVSTNTNTDATTAIDTCNLAASGIIPNDAAWLFHGTYTVSASGTQTFDLVSTLTDALGNQAALSKVYAMWIVNKTATSTYVLRVGNSNFHTFLDQATSYIVVGANGTLLLSAPVDGFGVTSSTGDVLTVANPNAGAVTFQIVIVGK